MNEQQFIEMLAEHGITCSEKQLNQFKLYHKLLVEWNEKMNLTAITEKEEVFEKHFYDSVIPSLYFDFSKVKTVCDVGAGAGFPSIPLKICYPHLNITIVDSLNKRITFLNELAKQLELDHVNFVHDRAETFGQNPNYRERFDVVTARAVAKMSVLSEFCLPLVEKNGTFIALKGAALNEELQSCKQGILTLGGELVEIKHYLLPIEKSERNIAIIKKVKNTPKKYPRKPGVPTKTPLEK